MRDGVPAYFYSDVPRDKALASAVVLRDCSLRPHTSFATRRVCRTMMREHAAAWRRILPFAAVG